MGILVECPKCKVRGSVKHWIILQSDKIRAHLITRLQSISISINLQM